MKRALTWPEVVHEAEREARHVVDEWLFTVPATPTDTLLQRRPHLFQLVRSKANAHGFYITPERLEELVQIVDREMDRIRKAGGGK